MAPVTNMRYVWNDAWRPLPVHKKSCPAAKRGKLAKILVMSFPLKNLLFYLFLPEYEILIEKVREAISAGTLQSNNRRLIGCLISFTRSAEFNRSRLFHLLEKPKSNHLTE